MGAVGCGVIWGQERATAPPFFPHVLPVSGHRFRLSLDREQYSVRPGPPGSGLGRWSACPPGAVKVGSPAAFRPSVSTLPALSTVALFPQGPFLSGRVRSRPPEAPSRAVHRSQTWRQRQLSQ